MSKKDFVFEHKGIVYYYYNSCPFTIFSEDELGNDDIINVSFSFDNMAEFILYVKGL